MQVHYRLEFDENGLPQMYVFKNCRAFIRTLPLLQYDPRKPEDLDTDGEDHVADEVRYFCMARPIKPVSATSTHGCNPLCGLLEIPREQLGSVQVRPRMEVINDG